MRFVIFTLGILAINAYRNAHGLLGIAGGDGAIAFVLAAIIAVLLWMDLVEWIGGRSK